MIYLDTSILGSYYCPESLSDVVSKALASAGRASISTVVELEFLSLVNLKVRTHELDKPAGQKVIGLFHKHVAAGMYGRVLAAEPEHKTAENWLAALNTPLRTLDALHLACAHVNQLQLWTTDKKLAASAKLLGVDYRLIST